MNKKLSIAYLVTFGLCLLLPLCLSDFKSDGLLENENRSRAGFPTLRKEDGSFNTNLKGDLSSWLNDNIGLRQRSISLHNRIVLDILGCDGGSDVLMGKNSFLFYTGDQNIEVGTGAKRVQESNLMAIANQQQEIRDYVKGYGSDFVLVLTPSKASIYTEHLYGRVASPITMSEHVYAFLTEHTDLKLLDVKSSLLAAKEQNPDELLFIKTDTHWNQCGAYVAYRYMVQEFSKMGIIPDSKPIEISSVGEYQELGDLNGLIGCRDESNLESLPDLSLMSPQAVICKDEKSEAMASIVEDIDKSPCFFYMKNGGVPKKTILILGDSMWDPKWKLPQFLAEHFSELVYVRCEADYFYPELLELFKPDIVLLGVTERFHYTRLRKKVSFDRNLPTNKLRESDKSKK